MVDNFNCYIVIYLLLIHWLIIILLMDKVKKLQNEPYMEEIRKIIKPIHMAKIEEAIDAENEDDIEKLLSIYLRKKEA